MQQHQQLLESKDTIIQRTKIKCAQLEHTHTQDVQAITRASKMERSCEELVKKFSKMYDHIDGILRNNRGAITKYEHAGAFACVCACMSGPYNLPRLCAKMCVRV